MLCQLEILTRTWNLWQLNNWEEHPTALPFPEQTGQEGELQPCETVLNSAPCSGTHHSKRHKHLFHTSFPFLPSFPALPLERVYRKEFIGYFYNSFLSKTTSKLETAHKQREIKINRQKSRIHIPRVTALLGRFIFGSLEKFLIRLCLKILHWTSNRILPSLH